MTEPDPTTSNTEKPGGEPGATVAELRALVDDLRASNRWLSRRVDELQGALANPQHDVREHRLPPQSRALGVALTDADGLLLTFNPRFSALTGYEPDELRGKPLFDLCHSGDLASGAQTFDRLANEPASASEIRLVRKTGPSRWVEWIVLPCGEARRDRPAYMALLRDVDARVAGLRALEQLESLLGSVGRVAEVGQFEWRIADDEVCWTPELERLYGFEPGGFDGTYRAWTEHIHPEDVSQVEAAYQDALSHGRFASEFRITRGDGSTRWLEARGLVEFDPAGMPERLVGIQADVSDYRRAEVNRRKHDELRRIALAAAQMGAWDLDLNTRIITGDNRGRGLFGFAQTVVPLDDAFERIHRDDRERIEQGFVAAIDPTSDGGYDQEYRICPEPGLTRWVRAIGQVLFEHHEGVRQAVRVIGVVMDISDRKRELAALRESEQRYRMALEGGALGTWTYDIEGRCAQWDQRSREIFGLPADEPIDLDVAMGVIHEEDRGTALAALTHALEHDARYEIEKRVARPSGDTCWVRTWGLVAPDGKTDGGRRLIGVVQDVTVQKRAEAALKEANARKDEYLAMLSHELRNPLAAIRTAGEVIGLGAEHDPMVARGCAVLDRQTRHMARLLDGLLDVSRITQGKLPLETRDVDLAGLMREVVSDLALEARSKGVAMHVELGDDVLMAGLVVRGDPVRLAQVFESLIGNAIKFTPGGGSITISATTEGGRVVVFVRDTGIGFAPELGPGLFEPFAQGPQDMSRSSGGLGLGLAFARGVVELHAGSLEGSSPGPGQGAEFVVRLPHVGAEHDAEGMVEYSASHPAICEILLVEDNEDSAEMLRTVLESAGYRVSVATRGREGVALAQARHPDVILCDLGLPEDMTGFEVADALRQDERTRAIPLVALTGYGRPEDKARTSAAGFRAHLTKPVDSATVLEVLASVTGR